MPWYANIQNWRLDKIDRNEQIGWRREEGREIEPMAAPIACHHCGRLVTTLEWDQQWRTYPYMVCELCLHDQVRADEHRSRIELEEMMDIFEAVKGQQFNEWLCELDMEDWRDDMDDRERRNDPAALMLNYISCG